jgi:hypothetical protein
MLKSKVVGQEVQRKLTMYMFMSYHEKTGQNHNMTDKNLLNTAKLKFGNQTDIQKEIRI